MDPKPRKRLDRLRNPLQLLRSPTIVHQPIALQQNRVTESLIKLRKSQLN
jgi:hypothetical protein